MSYRFVLCCVLFQTIVLSQKVSVIDQNTENLLKCSQSESSNPECQCSSSSSNHDFWLQCSIGGDELVYNTENASFRIQCPCSETNPLSADSVYKYLTRVPTNNISILKLDRCPLPKGSLSTFFGKHMNLTFIQTITIHSCEFSIPIPSLHEDSFHSMPQLEVLNLQKNYLEYIPDDLFNYQLNLKKLSLESNKLKNISEKIFKNLPHLRSLQLGANAIKQLEIGSFSNLQNLIQLNLQNNQLTMLPSDVLQSLTTLNYLDLSNNMLTSLDKDAFKFNSQLIELFLPSNSLEVLPEGVFRNNKMLQKLYLQFNTKLSAIHTGVFGNLVSLVELDLSNCSFKQSSFDNHTFSNLTQLTKLNLSRNKLIGLHSDWFIGLSNLIELDLSWNMISTIEDNQFSSSQRLSILKLNGNRLVRIEANIFKGIGALKSLYLEDNQIEVIEPEAMKYLVELTNINLARNLLKFDEGLVNPYDGWRQSPLQYNLKLESIDLSRNQIADLYSDWSSMNSLTRLTLSHNEFTNLAFTHITRFSPLRDFSLDLRSNKIRLLDFKWAELVDGLSSDDEKVENSRIAKKKIFLDDNPLVCDCNAYFMAQYMNHSMPNVKHSWKIIAPNLTCKEPSTLVGIAPSKVTPSQFLCNCTEYFLPCECYERPADRTLLFDCQHKNLTEIPSRLPQLVGYKVQMNLSSNSINIGEVNPNSFNCCADVTSLDLSNNGMESSMFATLGWAQNLYLRFPRLNRIDLTRNNFDSIPNGVIDVWNRTHNLTYNLSGNPWRCDCTNLALLKFIYNSWIYVEDFKQMRCDIGPLISELSVDKLCPNAALKYLTIAMPALALLLFCLCVILYRSRRVIRAWLYNRQLCLWCVVKEEENDEYEYDAFISFSHNDEKFVNEELVPQLESPPDGLPHYRLCLHYRDWLAGEWIPDQIVRSVASSKRTVVVLTENFLDSLWGKLEFRTAYQQVLKDKRMRLIVIVKGELPAKDKMDQELQTYISLNTYLKYDDPFFMERLRYALPHKKNAITPESRISQAIIESVGKDQANGVKPNHLPLLPLPTDCEKQKIHIILPPEVEMSLTPTSSSSSTAPFFLNSPE